jgi:hypothetical protein
MASTKPCLGGFPSADVQGYSLNLVELDTYVRCSTGMTVMARAQAYSQFCLLNLLSTAVHHETFQDGEGLSVGCEAEEICGVCKLRWTFK